MVSNDIGRRCAKCGHTKALAYFGPDKQAEDGMDRYCNLCRVIYPSLKRCRIVIPKSTADAEVIPLDPVGYAHRVERLQQIVNEVDAELGWARRRIIGTRPGLCPNFVEVMT